MLRAYQVARKNPASWISRSLTSFCLLPSDFCLLTMPTSSSSAAATTPCRPPSTWPRAAESRSSSSVAPIVGGCATTEEFAPGYRCPDARAHARAAAAVDRARHAARTPRRAVRAPDPRLVALGADGRAARLLRPTSRRTAEAIRPFSAKDAAKYPDVLRHARRLGAFLAPLLEMTPPSIDAPPRGELWELLKTGRRFRALGKQRRVSRCCAGDRWPVADLVAEWFETDLLQAAIAARGIFGAAMGPWSAGTRRDAAAARRRRSGAGRQQRHRHGRTRRGDARDGGRGARGRRRDPDGRRRSRACWCSDGARHAASRSTTAPRSPRAPSSRAPIRGARSSASSIRSSSTPASSRGSATTACPGTVAKVNLALARAAGVPRPHGDARRMLRGRVIVAPGIDYLERAFDASKYGEISPAPYLDITFPSLLDPSLAPAGRHVMSVHVQYTPYRAARRADRGRRSRDALGDIVLRTLDEHAPGIGGARRTACRCSRRSISSRPTA